MTTNRAEPPPQASRNWPLNKTCLMPPFSSALCRTVSQRYLTSLADSRDDQVVNRLREPGRFGRHICWSGRPVQVERAPGQRCASAPSSHRNRDQVAAGHGVAARALRVGIRPGGASIDRVVEIGEDQFSIHSSSEAALLAVEDEIGGVCGTNIGATVTVDIVASLAVCGQPVIVLPAVHGVPPGAAV